MNSNFKDKRFKIIMIILATLFILVITLEKLTARTPLTYENSIKSVEKENDQITIEFNSKVAGADIVLYQHEQEKYYNVLAWESPLSKLFKEASIDSKTIIADNKTPDIIHYNGINGLFDLVILGEKNDLQMVTLPRLAMNYYFSLAIAMLIFFSATAYIVKSKEKISMLLKVMAMISFAYIVSHVIVMGSGASTHFIMRDFSYVFVSFIILATSFIVYFFKNNKSISEV